jgi:hypothetical protein
MTPKTAGPKIWVARSTGVLKVRGVLHRYYAGQTVPSDSPLIRALPDRFELVDMQSAGVVMGPGTSEPDILA